MSVMLPPRASTGQAGHVSKGKHWAFLKEPLPIGCAQVLPSKGSQPGSPRVAFSEVRPPGKTRVDRAELLSLSPCLPRGRLTQAGSCPLLSPRNSRGTGFPVTCHLGRVGRVGRQGRPEHGRVNPAPAPPPLPSGRRPSQVPTGCQSLLPPHPTCGSRPGHSLDL